MGDAVLAQDEQAGVLLPQGGQHGPVDLGVVGLEAVALGGLAQDLIDLVELLAAQAGLVADGAAGLAGHALGALDRAAAVLGHDGGHLLRRLGCQIDDVGAVIGDGGEQLSQVGSAVAGVHADEAHGAVALLDHGAQQTTQVGLALGRLLLEPNRAVLGPQEGLAAHLVAVQGDGGHGLAAVLV